MSQHSVHSSTFFKECVSEIEVAYTALDHRLGWRFLNVSRNVLNTPVKVAFIAINPGGDSIPSDHPWKSCEAGLSHLVERWDGALPGQSELQLQVQGLFRMLADNLGFHGSFQELMAQSLVSQFIPFRSPTFAALPRQKESIEFGRRLWGRILPVASPKLIVCLGRDVQQELRALMPSTMECAWKQRQSFETGWGDYTADMDEFEGPRGIVRLLYLPHLSRFQLFTSQKCCRQMPIILAAACKNL